MIKKLLTLSLLFATFQSYSMSLGDAMARMNEGIEAGKQKEKMEREQKRANEEQKRANEEQERNLQAEEKRDDEAMNKDAEGIKKDFGG